MDEIVVVLVALLVCFFLTYEVIYCLYIKLEIVHITFHTVIVVVVNLHYFEHLPKMLDKYQLNVGTH